VSRAPFQVLVLPYRTFPSGLSEFAVFRRADEGYWQFIAGGGEDNETPMQAARREAHEESDIAPTSTYVRLDSLSTVRVVGVTGEFTWGPDVYVIPQHCFAVEVQGDLTISEEHTDCQWLSYSKADSLLRWDSNRTALWELDERLRRESARLSPAMSEDSA